MTIFWIVQALSFFFIFFLCPERESNSHKFYLHYILSVTAIPIRVPGHIMYCGASMSRTSLTGFSVQRIYHICQVPFSCGEWKIRTFAPCYRPNGLANRPLHHLGNSPSKCFLVIWGRYETRTHTPLLHDYWWFSRPLPYQLGLIFHRVRQWHNFRWMIYNYH